MQQQPTIQSKKEERSFGILTVDMKDYEITKEPNVDPSTISRDIGYLYSIILIYIVQLKEPFT